MKLRAMKTQSVLSLTPSIDASASDLIFNSPRFVDEQDLEIVWECEIIKPPEAEERFDLQLDAQEDDSILVETNTSKANCETILQIMRPPACGEREHIAGYVLKQKLKINKDGYVQYLPVELRERPKTAAFVPSVEEPPVVLRKIPRKRSKVFKFSRDIGRVLVKVRKATARFLNRMARHVGPLEPHNEPGECYPHALPACESRKKRQEDQAPIELQDLEPRTHMALPVNTPAKAAETMGYKPRPRLHTKTDKVCSAQIQMPRGFDIQEVSQKPAVKMAVPVQSRYGSIHDHSKEQQMTMPPARARTAAQRHIDVADIIAWMTGVEEFVRDSGVAWPGRVTSLSWSSPETGEEHTSWFESVESAC